MSSKKIRLRITVIPFVALLLAACGRVADEQVPEPPDYGVLITLDTLRADHLPFLGYRTNTAPFLSSLVERSASFKNCSSASSHTGPSHASIFTALYPSQHGLTRNGAPLDAEISTFVELARDDGMRTGSFASVVFLESIQNRFETFDAARELVRPEQKGMGEHAYRKSEATLARVKDWLGGLESNERFFLWVHLFDVHAWNEDPGAVWMEQVESAYQEAGLPEQKRAEYLVDLHGFDPRAAKQAEFRQRYLAESARYDAQIRKVDAGVAELYELIQQQFSDQTGLWMVMADHGEGLGSHSYWAHGKFLYEEQIRVPLLLHFTDDRFTGIEVTELVRTIDVLPTLVEAFRWEMDWKLPRMGLPSLEGRSLLPYLSDRRQSEPARMAFSERRPVSDVMIRAGWKAGRVLGLRTQQLKYVYHSGGEDEVYDLRSDPLELTNLAGDPPPEAAALREVIEVQQDLLDSQADGREPAEIDPAYHEILKQLGYLR